MQVQELKNGEIKVTNKNLVLHEFNNPIFGKTIEAKKVDIKGEKVTICDPNDEQFVGMFIALHNFKVEKRYPKEIVWVLKNPEGYK